MGVQFPRNWFYARHEIPPPVPSEETIGGQLAANDNGDPGMGSAGVSPIVFGMAEAGIVGGVTRRKSRERAQFSAGVEEARVLNTIQDGLLNMATHVRDQYGVFTDRSKLIEGRAPVAVSRCAHVRM